MQNRKKRKDFREMEVSLETNKKGMEVFQRIKKKEKQGNRIRSLIIFIIIVEILLGISLFEFCVKTNRIPTFIGIILLIIMGFLSYLTYKLQQKLENMFSEYSIFDEIQFVNNILKENAKLRETALCQLH